MARRKPADPGYIGSTAWRAGRFRNVADTRAGSLRAVMREFWANRGIRRKPRSPLPVTPVRADVLSGPASQALQVTWLGHSTTLIEIDGLRLLTDPVLSERASPLPFAGPKRFTPPALTVAQLPRIDARRPQPPTGRQALMRRGVERRCRTSPRRPDKGGGERLAFSRPR